MSPPPFSFYFHCHNKKTSLISNIACCGINFYDNIETATCFWRIWVRVNDTVNAIHTLNRGHNISVHPQIALHFFHEITSCQFKRLFTGNVLRHYCEIVEWDAHQDAVFIFVVFQRICYCHTYSLTCRNHGRGACMLEQIKVFGFPRVSGVDRYSFGAIGRSSAIV